MKRLRPWAGSIGSATATLILASLCAPAFPQARTQTTIENTAYVTYGDAGGAGGGGSATVEVTSNTVAFARLPDPTPGVVEFFARAAPGTPGAVDFPVDGGECSDLEGEFGPMPVLALSAALAISDVSPAVKADAFAPGQVIVVRVTDPNRNEDPGVREFIEVTLTTSDGDRELLRLQETGVDTGVFATEVSTVGIPPDPTICDCRLSVGIGGEVIANYVDPGFPTDAATTTAAVLDTEEEQVMVLQKQVSVPEATSGDFLQYRLVLDNSHATGIGSIVITDALPYGIHYQEGSLRVDGARVTPQLSADGRTLVVPVGVVEAGGQVQVTYVATVATEAPVGEAVNSAVARGIAGMPLGSVASNTAEAVVRIREPLFTSGFTIIGRVLAGACDVPESALEPLANVRLVLDDGTYVPTDENGAYHFEGVRPGTHVVQLDLATLPAHLEAVACREHTRQAGRGFSQFVEAAGGALMRADFRVQPKAQRTGEVGVLARTSEASGGRRHEVELDVGTVPVDSMRAMVMLPDGAAYVPGSATFDGRARPDPEVAGNIVTFDLGSVAGGWHGTLAFASSGAPCPATVRAVVLFEAGGESRRTPPAETTLPCNAAAGPADSGRQALEFALTPTAEEAVSPFQQLAEKRAALRADAGLPTGDRDWLAGQAPGNDWLLPGEGDAADPTEAVVVKHLPGHSVVLRVNGVAVGGLHANGNRTNAARTVSVAMWRGVPMAPGDNVLEADIVDAGGAIVATLKRTLHYTNDVVRAELVPEESLLVADGIHAPVIAVRMLDGAGKPVRAGVSGKYSVLPPHQPADAARMQQQRQLAGMESFAPTWGVEGKDGIAYIELQPTSLAGEAVLQFDFRHGERGGKPQEVKAWLKSQPRDWIVVGFAAGTIGHDTLAGNMQALDAAGREDGFTTDGQLSLYAKGRVLGKWMLTLAYDSDKDTDRLHRQGLLSTIDPNRFYTLYGDGTAQAYDAASAEKVYLKLERDQFYALFGDFTTGLDDGELTRYHRTLNGLKVEYRGPLLEVNAFAAKTRQDFARDELQGDGTSGLYRLSRGDIAINGERVRIETRDRYRSEVIVGTRVLVRHVDYDIDYAAGTLFFREPVPSRDFDFNPVFIVVEYETHGNGDEHLNAGGRVGVQLMEGRLRAGLTVLRDEDANSRTHLAGIDASYRLAEATELRAEVAASEGEAGPVERSGNAYLVELEHHGERLDLLAYVQRQDGGFGLGQQNAAERGMFKAGADVQWRIADNFALQGQAWHQENLLSGATRDAMNLRGEYRAEDWGMSAGLQWVRDQAAGGRMAESRQLTLGVNRQFLDDRLELTARADIGLGGRNDSVDFPTRIELGASYALTDAFRVLVAQEFTDGEDRDTTTTRLGFEATPWAGATLSSTLNQSRISEYGPRTFGVLGLAQRFLVGERWSLDLSADTSHAFDESGDASLLVNPEHPIAPGGIRRVGALTEDFFALSGGATYRSETWSWNGRLEHRDGEQSDRRGLSTGFLRQAEDGVAFAAAAQAFVVDNADGSQGLLAQANLSWAWRPLGSRWSLLDRLEFRLDELRAGTGAAVVGNDTLAVAGDARSRRLVNNLVLNYVGDPWTADDRRGNLFDASQRTQLSLYYGSKYVFDTYDGDDYSGYTDILGVEWRHDFSPKFDFGLRASVRHAWDEGVFSYAAGPSFGFTPFTNAWFSLGYNVIGFSDRDFEAMHYTAQGPYLMMRFKFDQQTLGLARTGP